MCTKTCPQEDDQLVQLKCWPLSFEEIDMKSIDDERYNEADQLVVHTTFILGWSSLCGYTFTRCPLLVQFLHAVFWSSLWMIVKAWDEVNLVRLCNCYCKKRRCYRMVYNTKVFIKQILYRTFLQWSLIVTKEVMYSVCLTLKLKVLPNSEDF